MRRAFPMSGPTIPPTSVNSNQCLLIQLRYGLVGAFRVPRSALEGAKGEEEIPKDVSLTGANGLPDDVDLDEYVLSDEEEADGTYQPVSQSRLRPEGVEVGEPESVICAAEQGHESASEDCLLWSGEGLPEDPKEQEEYLEGLSLPVDHVVLRYFVGLKSKSGADVTAAIQRMEEEESVSFPLADEPVEEAEPPSAPDRRLRKKSSVRFVEADQGVHSFSFVVSDHVRRHLTKWKGATEAEVAALEEMSAIRRLRGDEASVMKIRAWITDIKNAFLLASLPESMKGKILLRPPKLLEGMAITQPGEVWVIQRAVYGLRQSPKWWSDYRDRMLRSADWMSPRGRMRLRQSSVEANLWHLLDESDALLGYAIVYVDDIMVLASREDAGAFYKWIRSVWQCTPLEGAEKGKPTTFLGVEVQEDEDEFGTLGFVLSQCGYIEELIRSYGMNPVPRSVPYPREWVKEFPSQEDYGPDILRKAQRVTGEVLWVAQRSRPDIAYPVALMGSWCTRDIQLWMLLMLIVMQLPEVEAADDEEGAAEPLSLELSALALMMMMSALFVWESAKYCLQRSSGTKMCKKEETSVPPRPIGPLPP
ncbi:Copia protein [Symbiodinium microadriaticum]|uniref:Copia protein n=1 Tax=Symbiodinium microadriaticum TaxID=2951 RepID=A0A1Q9DYM3_SYMMI|nr:Copia protein [Symbiodinium microadriaticum]